jgi:hypothetical protein
MESKDPADGCVLCGKPIPPGREAVCSLDEGCCPACFAACARLDKCAKLRDAAVWEKIEHVRRLVRESTYPGKKV